MQSPAHKWTCEYSTACELRKYLESVQAATRREDGSLVYHDDVVRSCMATFQELYLRYLIKQKEHSDNLDKIQGLLGDNVDIPTIIDMTTQCLPAVAPAVLLDAKVNISDLQLQNKDIEASVQHIIADMQQLRWLIEDQTREKHSQSRDPASTTARGTRTRIDV